MSYEPPQYPPTRPLPHDGPVPPQSAPPAGYWQQPPAPKKRRWPWIVAGVLVLGVLGCVGLFTLVLGGTAAVVGEAVTEADDNQKGKNAATGVLGKPATDGKFEFTVTGMKCGATSVGGEFTKTRAQGQFCQVTVTVKNVGTSAEIFDSGSQKAYAADATEFSVDTAAELAVNEDNQTWLENINPGNQVKGTLVFDVPKGTKLTSIVVHESMFTPGIRVPLA
jgi:hypothetical protein